MKSAIESSKANWIDALLLFGILAVMCVGLGQYGLYEPHEGHFAGVGREMYLSGDWITPKLNGAPYLNKPPLFYWIIASSYSLFGISEYSARLPLAFIGWSGILLAWQWARKLWGIRAGRFAAVMLAVSAGWYIFCHQLLIDILLSVLNLACTYFLWVAVTNRDSWKHWAVMYVSIALAVMSKGLLGIAFPLSALFFFAIWRRDYKLWSDARPAMGMGIMTLITGPWLLLLNSRNPGSVWYMIVNEHLKRIADTRWPPDYDAMKVSWWLYIVLACVWAAPWSILLPQTISFAAKNARHDPQRSAAEADAVALLSLAALLPIVTFLPMSSRLIYYSLPAVPAFVVLTAGWWSRADRDALAKQRTLGAISMLLFGIVIFSAGFWILPLLQHIPQLLAAPEMFVYIPRLAWVLGIAIGLGGLFLALNRPALSAGATALVLAGAGIYNLGGFAQFDSVESSCRTVASLLPRVPDNCVWISEGSKEIGASAGIAFYLGVKDGRARSVLVMEDDKRRPPPDFPGPKAGYLINQEQLKTFWNGAKPALFITDFTRTNWLDDYPQLPQGPCNRVEINGSGNRRVYANAAAWKLLEQNVNLAKRTSFP